ncbi:MAG: capsular biosynthesis protein, partial [Novosphingobium sp.]|nr:capsular biosynthesis protein [Novosphingobium sp.]
MPEKLAAASKPRARTLASQRPTQTAVAAPAPADPAPVATPEPASISPEPQAVEFKSARQAIKRDRLREEGMIVPDGPVTGLVEEFRIVKREILRGMAALASVGMGINGASQRILISSPHSGEGKTFCAINLAFSLAAERDAEVVLVDADFARPSILSRLGLKGGAGLMDALADPSANVEDFVIGTDVEGLWVLPSGNRTNADSEYLASARAAAVL